MSRRKKLTREQEKAMFSKLSQSSHARRIDKSLNANKVYNIRNSDEVKRWQRNPNRSDIKGVDDAPHKKVKQPWEMTREEWYKDRREAFRKTADNPNLKSRVDSQGFKQNCELKHMEYVEKAIKDGKQVPKDVIEDYPQFQENKTDELSKEERIALYKEKQERRLERAEYMAQKHEQASKDRFEQSNKAVAGIPFGQPILVGHHSERMHRNAIKRSDTNMRKGFEHSDKAEHYKKKAENIKSNTTISSDDPEAIDKLKIKLDKMEQQRTKYKEHNKKARKQGTEQLPKYVLSNLGQNINTVKKRISYLEEQEKIPSQSKKINNVEIKTNKVDNRVELYFPGKPSSDFRSKLKRNGFRWSPKKGAWQRQLNNSSLYWAEDLAKKYE